MLYPLPFVCMIQMRVSIAKNTFLKYKKMIKAKGKPVNTLNYYFQSYKGKIVIICSET